MGVAQENKANRAYRALAREEGLLILGHRYVFEQELTMERLMTDPEFADHHRLSMFIQKGCTCVKCGRVGARFIAGKDRGGFIHYDVYTEDLVMMTVDHIIPKSRGGNNHIDNYQPMCGPCNSAKGNRMEGEEPVKRISSNKSKKRGLSFKQRRIQGSIEREARTTNVHRFLKDIHMDKTIDKADKNILGKIYRSHFESPPQEFFDQVVVSIFNAKDKIMKVFCKWSELKDDILS